MGYVDREKIEQLIKTKPDCFSKCDTREELLSAINSIVGEKDSLLREKSAKFTGTWALEKDLWLQSEKNELEADTETLSRGRVVLVNPGVANIGREQKYVHLYIVLGEYRETFIGVPITNKARNKETGEYYLRNFFEVELIHSKGDKPFDEYRCNKPSVADVRNISGLDKRRIIKDDLYFDKKFAPSSYLNAVSKKIRSSLAIILEDQTEEDS